jgi:hypothetical protein
MPTISNTVCVECRVEMRCSKTGDRVQELDDRGGGYKVWSCDRFQCPVCLREVLVNFGRAPIAEHYQPEYDAARASASLSFGGGR